MKFIDTVIKANADGENYDKGLRLELTHVEISLIKKACELSQDYEELSPLWRELQKVVDDLETAEMWASKGCRNIEID